MELFLIFEWVLDSRLDACQGHRTEFAVLFKLQLRKEAYLRESERNEYSLYFRLGFKWNVTDLGYR